MYFSVSSGLPWALLFFVTTSVFDMTTALLRGKTIPLMSHLVISTGNSGASSLQSSSRELHIFPSLQACRNNDNDSADGNKSFPESTPPNLAIITEPDACDSRDRMEETYQAIREAVSTGQVDLVSIRLTPAPTPTATATTATYGSSLVIKDDESSSKEDQDENNIIPLQERLAYELTHRLVQLSQSLSLTASTTTNPSSSSSSSVSHGAFRVVCSSDWIDVALRANAHGIHVKERHLSQIPIIRNQFSSSQSNNVVPVLIGTSVHSVESALTSYRLYQPDYYFVGTCYLTASHPEKTEIDMLEGPTLPGQVRRALLALLSEKKSIPGNDDNGIDDFYWRSATPKVLAIGGIDERNCHEPVVIHGADGVAVIRAVLAAEDPSLVVTAMQLNMQRPQ